MDQWNRIESPEVNPYIYGQLILDKGGKNMQWRKDRKQYWESWTTACKSKQSELSLTPYTKINSKQSKDLNIKHDIIKLLEENISKTLSNKNCSNVFLGQSLKVKEIKAKIHKGDIIKLTSFCTGKETINKMKKQPMDREKILTNDVTNKGLISKINKQFIQLNIKK